MLAHAKAVCDICSNSDKKSGQEKDIPAQQEKKKSYCALKTISISGFKGGLICIIWVLAEAMALENLFSRMHALAVTTKGPIGACPIRFKGETRKGWFLYCSFSWRHLVPASLHVGEMGQLH